MKRKKVTRYAFPYILFAVTIMLVVTLVTAVENHQALCTFRADLQARADQSRQIVREHPELLKQFGFTPAQVRVQIHNQQASVDSLNGLYCFD